jgi:hypothetical protein
LRVNNDQASAYFWVILGLAVALFSTKYGLGTPESPGTGFMPFLAGLAIFFLAAIGAVHGLLPGKKTAPWKPIFNNVSWKKSSIVLAALIAYVLLLRPLGFTLCTALFIAFLMRVVEPQKWPAVAAGAIGTALGAYGIFELWLKAQLPRGPWGF